MTHGQYEIVFHKDGTRHAEKWGIMHQAVERAKSLLNKGYFPVVVYDEWKQEWVEVETQGIPSDEV